MPADPITVSPAAADMTYLAHRRTVSVNTLVAPDVCQQSATAPDLGPAMHTVECRSEEPQGGYSEAAATMWSELRDDAIVVSATCAASWSSVGGSIGSYSAGSMSLGRTSATPATECATRPTSAFPVCT